MYADIRKALVDVADQFYPFEQWINHSSPSYTLTQTLDKTAREYLENEHGPFALVPPGHQEPLYNVLQALVAHQHLYLYPGQKYDLRLLEEIRALPAVGAIGLAAPERLFTSKGCNESAQFLGYALKSVTDPFKALGGGLARCERTPHGVVVHTAYALAHWALLHEAASCLPGVVYMDVRHGENFVTGFNLEKLVAYGQHPIQKTVSRANRFLEAAQVMEAFRADIIYDSTLQHFTATFASRADYERFQRLHSAAFDRLSPRSQEEAPLPFFNQAEPEGETPVLHVNPAFFLHSGWLNILKKLAGMALSERAAELRQQAAESLAEGLRLLVLTKAPEEEVSRMRISSYYGENPAGHVVIELEGIENLLHLQALHPLGRKPRTLPAEAPADDDTQPYIPFDSTLQLQLAQALQGMLDRRLRPYAKAELQVKNGYYYLAMTLRDPLAALEQLSTTLARFLSETAPVGWELQEQIRTHVLEEVPGLSRLHMQLGYVEQRLR